uniref:Uncharacterized protein n=1 Tax=Sus scrofa TaxID=9823 RepID=A0A8D0JD78_PIG
MEFLQKETHCGCALGSALAVPSLWSEALEPEAHTAPPLVGLAGVAKGRVLSSSHHSCFCFLPGCQME